MCTHYIGSDTAESRLIWGGGFFYFRAQARNARAKLKSDTIFESAIKFDPEPSNISICSLLNRYEGGRGGGLATPPHTHQRPTSEELFNANKNTAPANWTAILIRSCVISSQLKELQ